MATSTARSHATVVVVLLYVRPGREEEFRAYEQQAADIMADYGGSVERVIAPYAVAGELPTPDEVHIVTFPDAAALAAYQSDPRMLALRTRREKAIANAVLILGRPSSPTGG